MPRSPCTPSAAARRASRRWAHAQLAVDWFRANVATTGRSCTGTTGPTTVPETGYNDTRHAGVLLSSGRPRQWAWSGAAEPAEAGLTWVDAHLVDTPIGVGFGQGTSIDTGSVALLAAALDERRLATGRPDRDELLLGLGRTLMGTIDDDGSVSADIDPVDGPGTTRSPFFTGEALWALARLHLTFPGEGSTTAPDGCGVTSSRTATPSSHPGPRSRSLGGLCRRNDAAGPTHRHGPPKRSGGSTASSACSVSRSATSRNAPAAYPFHPRDPGTGAGVGTLGEGLDHHRALDRRSARPGDREVLQARAHCVGLLVARQITPGEAAGDTDPDAITGVELGRRDADGRSAARPVGTVGWLGIVQAVGS
ncbi:MAG: hypothetical protein R2695_10520 [Acidimicrobiales bacterium]